MASRSFVTIPALVVRMLTTERSCQPVSIPNCFATAIVWMLLLQTTVVTAWSTSRRAVIHKGCSADNSQMTPLKLFGLRSNSRSIFQPTRLQSSSTTAEMEEDRLLKETKNPRAFLGVNAYSGLTEKEFSVLIATVEDAYAELVGLAGVACETATASVNNSGENLPVGALCRVLSLTTNLDEESAECLRALIAERMDHLIYGTGELQQPVLVSVSDSKNNGSIEAIIRGEIEQYGLRTPICSAKNNGENQESVDEEADMHMPSFRIDIDGAETSIGDSGETFWDASSVVVFDNLVSDDLRRRLLEVVKGKSSDANEWNDVENGPDPNRWVRGGLQDIPDEGEEGKDDDENKETLSCWGLPTEAIEELCFQQHEAIDEFESIVTNLFPQFVVSRLPEAVYGECVSPLTANAPVAGEEDLYDYHIDGDPLQTPPSPWTDVYGRYPNRSKGKPRFLSCILYLNDEWEASEWGAPTKFYDPPTQNSYEVLPKPGRCVFLDQDLGHTVTPPKPAAGKRPRYSLVWKLVFHPKRQNQDMTDLSNENSSWPEPVLFGSAANRP